jgi:hypothetical protein
MRRSSGRAGTEPLAALVAVAVVCSAVSLYAGLLPVPQSTDRNAAAAERLLDRVYDRTAETGVVHPGRLGSAVPSAEEWQSRWRVNVSVESGTATWRRGPSPPAGADSVARATRRVSVRQPLGGVRPGRLRVVVW